MIDPQYATRSTDLPFLQDILNMSINSLISEPYSNNIVQNAKEFHPYVGKACGGIVGHCTYAKNNKNSDKNDCRKEIYFNEDYLLSLLIKELNTCQSNEQSSLYETSKKYIGNSNFDQIKIKLSTMPQEEVQLLNNNKEFLSIKSNISKNMTNIVAHEFSHARQYNTKDVGFAYASKSSIAAEKQMQEMIRKYQEKNSPAAETKSQKEINDGIVLDYLLEAGVMANSFVASLLINGKDNKNALGVYKGRLSDEHLEEIGSMDNSIIKQKDQNGEYTKDAIATQQQIARKVYSYTITDWFQKKNNLYRDILSTNTSQAQPENAILDFSSKDMQKYIDCSYWQDVFGSKEEYHNMINNSISKGTNTVRTSSRISKIKETLGIKSILEDQTTQTNKSIDYSKLSHKGR